MLACTEIAREAEFLRALGWVEAPSSEDVHRVFQGTNGLVVALYAAKVDEVYAHLESIDGVEVLEEPFDSPHGFRGFTARDPEGNLRDVAWKAGSTVTPNGDLIWN